jgi:hypothetical protein
LSQRRCSRRCTAGTIIITSAVIIIIIASLGSAHVFTSGSSVSVALAEAREDAENNRADVLASLATTVSGASVRLADPFGPLCYSRGCPVQRGGAILYRDDDHLSASGARSLAPWFAEFAAWVAGSGKVAGGYEPGRSLTQSTGDIPDRS